MKSVAEYIVEIGTATEAEARFALGIFLLKRFQEEGTFDGFACPEGKEAVYVAVSAVANVVFGEIDLEHSGSESWMGRRRGKRPLAKGWIPEHTVQFASDNAPQINKEARRLSSDDKLSSILSAAAYNTCYARYIGAGGSRGIFSNLFITYIRTLFKDDYHLFGLETSGKISALDTWILRPMHAMLAFGILRHFPHNPDEREYYNAVHEFAVAMKRLEDSVSERRRTEPDRRMQEVPTVAEKRLPEYPTEKQMLEIWQAYKSGIPGAMEEDIRRRRAEMKEKQSLKPMEAQEPNQKNIAGARPPAPAENSKSVARRCPECGSPYLVQKILRSGIYLECPNKKKAAEPADTGVACSYSKWIGDAPPR